MTLYDAEIIVCGFRKKHKAYISKYKAHILKQVPCIFCLSKCLKNNMVQKPPNRASARRKSAVGK